MRVTRYWNTSRLILPASILLVFGLLASCTEDTSAGSNAGDSVQTSNGVAAAAEQYEVVFSVPDMTCPMCPITVKRALNGVDGVIEADTDLKTKQARALFDPSRTDTGALIATIEKSGFNAHLKERDHE